MCSCFLELRKLSEKQIKIKTMELATFMYFQLNYCDENHIEKIPIPVKDIGHIFYLASEIIKADRPHLLLLSDALELMIMNTQKAQKTVQN